MNKLRYVCFAYSLALLAVANANNLFMVQRPEVATDSALTLLAERARLFGERIPQEKVYVQMDNTGYFLGDTIWFAAHTRRTDTGRPSRVSRMLYAELWNHDGFLVERKLVEMREGKGHGFFALPDTLYAGYFELRAYTRWQLNWGQTEHPHNKNTELWFYNKEMAKDYFQDYEKLYSRVFPVYDKPRQEGEYVQEMTLRPIRRYFRSEKDKPRPMLSLFPEGGSLLYNYPCNMAFEVATTEGEELTGSLVICLDRHNYVPYIWDYSKDVYIQNENINGETRYYIGNVIKIGKNVTTFKPSGNVNIQNSSITVIGKQLELHPGTFIDKNFIFQNR